MSRAKKQSPSAQAPLDHAPPVDDPVTELPATAQRILAAARSVLSQKGFGGLTFDAISAKAGENRALIRYYFGNKAGLVTALVDWMDHEDTAQVLKELAGEETGRDRLAALLRMQRDNCKLTRANQPFFDLVPHILRDKAMRARFAEIYDWYRQFDSWVMAPGAGGRDKEEAGRLATLAIAVYDGIALQRASDPELDVDAVYATWERLLRAALERLDTGASPVSPGAEPPAADPPAGA